MTRKNTNKQYSLRKLKKGTASVAVALSVLGAGLASQTEVKAETSSRSIEDLIEKAGDRDQVLKKIFDDYTGATTIHNSNGYKRKTPTELSNLMQEIYRELLAKKEELDLVSKEFHNTINKKIESDNANKQRIGELKQEIKDLQEAMQGVVDTLSQASHQASDLYTQNKALQAESEAAAQKALDALNNKNEQIAKLVNDNENLKEAIEDYVDTIQQASREVSVKQQELAATQLQLQAKNAEIENLKHQDNVKAEEIAKLESEAKVLENLIGSGKRELGDLEAKLADANAQKAKLESEAVILENLIGSGKHEIAELQAKLDQANADKAKLESETAILEKLIESGKRELAEQQAKLDAANADNAKLTEDKQVLEASRKRTSRDLEAARDAKKATEAELAETNAKVDKLEEEKQILEASRKRTNRDLEAARDAKKQVDAELAKLKAEAEALKEQLAKQAQEIEKLKESKEKAPEAPQTPEKPEVPGKPSMPWTALTPATPIAKDDKKADGKAAPVAKSETKAATNQLPSTGETANPFFTAAAMAVIATAGVVAVAKRKEEN